MVHDPERFSKQPVRPLRCLAVTEDRKPFGGAAEIGAKGYDRTAGVAFKPRRERQRRAPSRSHPDLLPKRQLRQQDPKLLPLLLWAT